MTGLLKSDAIDNFLQHHYLGRIGCHNKELTYVLPVCYAYDGKAVYCHSNSGEKIEVMRENPNVCFEVDTLHNVADWQTVTAWGEFEEIEDPEQRAKALQLLLDRELPTIISESFKLCEEWPFHPGNLNEIPGIVFRINLNKKTGKYEMPDN